MKYVYLIIAIAGIINGLLSLYTDNYDAGIAWFTAAVIGFSAFAWLNYHIIKGKLRCK